MLRRFFVGAFLALSMLLAGQAGVGRADDPFAPPGGKPGAAPRAPGDPFAPPGGRASQVAPPSGGTAGMVPGVIPPKDVVTVEQAKAVFEWMKNQDDIPFRYTKDGCYARAHLMLKRMQGMGMSPSKIWAMADSKAADLFVVTPYGSDTVNGARGQRWNWHCAPALKLRLPNGTVGTCVIDPSLFDRPVLLETWKSAFVSLNGARLHFPESPLGQTPELPNGTRSTGTGYLPWREESVGNVDAHAVKTCKEYKALKPAIIR